MPKVAQVDLATRAELADLCNDLNLIRAVEVGTDRGLFAWDFLARWRGEMLWCVDSYEPYPEMPYDRRGDLAIAANVLAPYADRVKIVVASSIEAARIMGPWPQFVYIDGAHAYDAVRADIAVWWDVLIPGGILSGHDFDQEHADVMRAVTEFADANGLTVQLTQDAPASWWVQK